MLSVPTSRWAHPGWKVLWGVGLFLLLLLLGREVLVARLLRRAAGEAGLLGRWGATGPDVGTAAPESVKADPAGLALLASWLESGAEPSAGTDPPLSVAPASASESSATRAGSPVRLGPEPPPSVRLSRESVLRLAEGGAVPRGVSRAAAWGMPAGIEILEGGALGIGWFPGDRLTHVEGVPVFERSLVIQKVLERRQAGAPVISGTLARRTRAGVRSFLVVVEQPYPGDSAPPLGGAPLPAVASPTVAASPAARLSPGAASSGGSGPAAFFELDPGVAPRTPAP